MNRFQDQKGIALVIVMMAVLALMIIVVEFVYSTRVYYAMAANSRDQLQAEYMAKSAIQLSILLLKYQKQIDDLCSRNLSLATCKIPPLYQLVPIDSGLLRGAMGLKTSGVDFSETERKGLQDFLDFHGDFSAKIEDEGGKINLNTLANVTNTDASPTPNPGPSPNSQPGQSKSEVTVDQLLALTDAEEYDVLFDKNMTREELIYNIQDWVDQDSDRSGPRGGVEDSLYVRKDPKYATKNAKFDTVEEIALVEGVNQDFLDTFRSSLTVYGDTNTININAANRSLLMGFVGKLIDSGNQEEIGRIVDWIDENRTFKTQEEFLKGMDTLFGLDRERLNEELLNTISFTSTLFSITATGTVGEVEPITRTIQAVLSTTPSANRSGPMNYGGGLRVLYWRVR